MRDSQRLQYHNRKLTDRAALGCSSVQFQYVRRGLRKKKKCQLWVCWELPWRGAEQAITSYCTIWAVFILDSLTTSTSRHCLGGSQSGLNKKRQTALNSLKSCTQRVCLFTRIVAGSDEWANSLCVCVNGLWLSLKLNLLGLFSYSANLGDGLYNEVFWSSIYSHRWAQYAIRRLI